MVDDEWLSVECQYISQSFIIGQYVRLVFSWCGDDEGFG